MRVLWTLVAAAAVALVVRGVLRLVARQRARELLLSAPPAARTPGAREVASTSSDPVVEGEDRTELPQVGIRGWLHRAGYRRPDAPTRFWLATAVGGVVGALAAVLLVSSGTVAAMATALREIPGNVGVLFLPIIHATPVLVCAIGLAIPTVLVRRTRARREAALLRDLAPSIELFASLAQAGLAFDASLERVLLGLDEDEPLAREFRALRVELLAGVPRGRAYMRLAERVDLPQFHSLMAAVRRAHEIGTSLSGTLRRQADDMRSFVRERALAQAQSLPARLVFPLVICFLPGIFVITLGPAFFEFVSGTAGFGVRR